MIPLRDNIPARTVPFVNYTMIGICGIVFLMQLMEGNREPSLVERYGMIPARITHPGKTIEIVDQKLVDTRGGLERVEYRRPAAPAAVPAVFTLLTCIFLHGGFMHFAGNMWFLYIFGDNVEDRFGHVLYLIFYLAFGVVASLSHLLTAPSSSIPTIGASGAIAGIMGAYMVLYPKAHVVALVPLGYYLQSMVLPAPLFLGFWFLIQLFQGTLAIAGPESTGVAWWAHIGGFAVGAAAAGMLKLVNGTRPPVDVRLPGTEIVGVYDRRQWR